MAEIEIGLGTILRDEHFAVLEGTHRARIDIDIRIEFDDPDSKPAVLKDASKRSGCDALAERGDDTTGDKHVPGRGLHHLVPP